MRRDTDLIGNEDMGPGGDDGGPEDGHGGAHHGKVDFETGEDEGLGVPEGKVEAACFCFVVVEGAPEAEDGHEDDTGGVC